MIGIPSRRARIPLLAVALSSMGLAPPAAADCTLSLAAAVPLELGEGGHRLLVQATADGAPLHMVVDTGAANLLLTQQAADRVAAHQSGLGDQGDQRFGYASGVGGSHEATALDIGRLQIGSAHGAFEAIVMDRIFRHADSSYDGLLGMTVLANFDIDLDIPDRSLRLYHAAGDCSRPAAALDQPLYAAALLPGYLHQVLLDVRVQIDGQTFRAQLDTGAPRTVIFGAAASRLGFAVAGQGSATFKGGGIGGEVTLTHQVLSSIAVGPVAFRNVTVDVDPESMPDADMLLGLDFLSRVHAWISISSHTLVMQYPPRPSPALAP